MNRERVDGCGYWMVSKGRQCGRPAVVQYVSVTGQTAHRLCHVHDTENAKAKALDLGLTRETLAL